MREFSETTARNLLRKPLVMGVPIEGLFVLAFGTLGVTSIAGSNPRGQAIAAAFAVLGYGLLRVLSAFGKNGWEERLIFLFENKSSNGSAAIQHKPFPVLMQPADPLEQDTLVSAKEEIRVLLQGLNPGDSLSLIVQKSDSGATISQIESVVAPKYGRHDLITAALRDLPRFGNVYSLYRLPAATDPLWISSLFASLPLETSALVRFKGIDPYKVKTRIEGARRGNSQFHQELKDIDSQVSFEEASRILEGLSRGEEQLLECSLIILSMVPLRLDPGHFVLEKDWKLPVFSATGLRKRFHRSHLARGVSCSDLVPTFLDAKDDGISVLTTRRGAPLYFNPQDSRLEALHWVVSGASGSGKSFFTVGLLSRLIERGMPMSVLFIDHNRSFKRAVHSKNGTYLEPDTLESLDRGVPSCLTGLDTPGTFAGVELSDLSLEEKRAASVALLISVEAFLRARQTTHPIYIVLDECWNFMRDASTQVQRAFREFRKLNGAAVAITQSLSDFLVDQSGQSIFQNAPIRVLLRQGEDVSRYQGFLGLNTVEVSLVKGLRQVRGEYSECLIKTPFSSQVGRLYPTDFEYSMFRTDNLREELVRAAKAKQLEALEVGRC